MKKHLLFFTVGILILTACSSQIKQELEQQGNTILPLTTTTTTTNPPDPALTEGGSIVIEEEEVVVLESPSLPEFFEKKFDGRDLTLGRVLAKNDVYTRYYITYKSGELTISGIMNVPAEGDGPFPVLILNHGYIDPAIYTNGRGLKREQDYFARRGYVVLHPDYRNHADSDKDPENEHNLRLGYLEDVINAVYAVKTSDFAFLDGERIGMLGHSMGGGITEGVIVTQPDLISAAIFFAPVSVDVRDNFEKWTRTRPEVAKVIIERHQEPAENPAFWDNISPLHFLNRVEVPVLIHHGTADKDVPLAWSEKFEKALREKGKDVELLIYENQPHEFTSAWPKVMQRSVEFFDAHVRNQNNAEN